MLAAKLTRCEQCGADIECKSKRHRFCSDKCRYAAQERRRVGTAKERARQRTGYMRRKLLEGHKPTANPWLLGAPKFGGMLPGGGFELSFANGMTFEHRQVSALHGIVTSITGRHDRNLPNFTLLPWPRGCGWAVYCRDVELAKRLANSVLPVRIGSREIDMKTGMLYRPRAPRIDKRGRRRLQIDAITPVCCRRTNGPSQVQTCYTAPTSSTIRSTMATLLTKRLGVDMESEAVCVELVSRNTEPSTLSLAGRDGRLGNIRGWVGSIVVEANAVSHWLLGAAETLGLGGTTSFGCGRIRVSEL